MLVRCFSHLYDKYTQQGKARKEGSPDLKI